MTDLFSAVFGKDRHNLFQSQTLTERWITLPNSSNKEQICLSVNRIRLIESDGATHCLVHYDNGHQTTVYVVELPMETVKKRIFEPKE